MATTVPTSDSETAAKEIELARQMLEATRMAVAAKVAAVAMLRMLLSLRMDRRQALMLVTQFFQPKLDRNTIDICYVRCDRRPFEAWLDRVIDDWEERDLADALAALRRDSTPAGGA